STVTVTRRVVRSSSRTRSRDSSCCTSWVTVARPRSRSWAARVKLPLSTTRTKACIASKRSMALPGRLNCLDSTNSCATSRKARPTEATTGWMATTACRERPDLRTVRSGPFPSVRLHSPPSCTPRHAGQRMNPNYLDFEQPIADLEAKIQALRNASTGPAVNVDAEVKALQDKLRIRTAQIFRDLTPWQVSQMSRHPQRPYTLDYVQIICDEFQELAGDRAFADDKAIVGGLARVD